MADFDAQMQENVDSVNSLGRAREQFLYDIVIRQEPKQARMCGIGADRRPIDPPPIIQLRVLDPTRRQPNAAGEDENSSDTFTLDYLQNPYYFMFASLAKPGSEAEVHFLKDGKTRCTTGSVVSSLYHLKDIENHGVDAGFFVFPDLSVRVEGSFRLKLSLYEVVGEAVRHCKSIFSSSFYVYTAKKFPGMEESTALSCVLADQGIKIRIRRDIRVRKRGAPQDDADEDGGAPETTEVESSAKSRKGKASGKRVRISTEPSSSRSGASSSAGPPAGLPPWPQTPIDPNLAYAGPVGGVGASPVEVPIATPPDSPSVPVVGLSRPVTSSSAPSLTHDRGNVTAGGAYNYPYPPPPSWNTHMRQPPPLQHHSSHDAPPPPPPPHHTHPQYASGSSHSPYPVYGHPHGPSPSAPPAYHNYPYPPNTQWLGMHPGQPPPPSQPYDAYGVPSPYPNAAPGHYAPPPPTHPHYARYEYGQAPPAAQAHHPAPSPYGSWYDTQSSHPSHQPPQGQAQAQPYFSRGHSQYPPAPTPIPLPVQEQPGGPPGAYPAYTRTPSNTPPRPELMGGYPGSMAPSIPGPPPPGHGHPPYPYQAYGGPPPPPVRPYGSPPYVSNMAIDPWLQNQAMPHQPNWGSAPGVPPPESYPSYQDNDRIQLAPLRTDRVQSETPPSNESVGSGNGNGAKKNVLSIGSLIGPEHGQNPDPSN